MPFDLQKLNTLVDDMVHEETHSWFCEAELLISSGMILQSMDVSLSQYFERELGPITVDEKKAAIAEFHRQMLAAMGRSVPDRRLDPDPLLLPRLHEAPPYRPSNKHSSQWNRFTEAEIDELYALLRRERPELIAHYEVDLQRWVSEGRPRGDGRGRSQFAGGAIEALILQARPDLASAEAGNAIGKIITRINASYL